MVVLIKALGIVREFVERKELSHAGRYGAISSRLVPGVVKTSNRRAVGLSVGDVCKVLAAVVLPVSSDLIPYEETTRIQVVLSIRL